MDPRLREIAQVQERWLSAAEANLVRRYSALWEELAAELESELEAIFTGRELGNLPAWQLAQSRRLALAIEHAATRLSEVLAEHQTEIMGALPGEVAAVLDAHHKLLAAQLPGPLSATLVAVHTTALDAIVARVGERITAAHLPLPQEAEAVLKAALVRGVAVGEHPTETARKIIRQTRGSFLGGLTRATTITRTEMADAAREAMHQYMRANAAVIRGWVWYAALDVRTCPACIAMHGTEHPVTEPGPRGHHRCRCTAVPLTRTWAELGFPGTPETPVIIQTGEDWYNQLDQQGKVAAVGATRARLLAEGRIRFSDLAHTRHTEGWRDSIHQTPVKDLEAISR